MSAPGAEHTPVLLDPILSRAAPVEGNWLDGTFGAGGHSRGLLDAGAESVVAVDRDPSVFGMAAPWAGGYGGRLRFVEGDFAQLDSHAEGPLDGVVLDLGVSSMQLDRAERGFSFRRDGPLDMRMSGRGRSAADLVNTASEHAIADILFRLGEETASRRIAKVIVARRPLSTTLELADAIVSAAPRRKPGRSHPATRSFQAIRMAVNGEIEALADGLEAAERALGPGGFLAVVTFHSIEDRIVKRFLRQAAGADGGANRHAPEPEEVEPRFEHIGRGAIEPTDEEVGRNPRARSARLRMARRTRAPAAPADRGRLGLPVIELGVPA